MAGLLLILVAAKVGGVVSQRVGLPAVFGQVAAGLLLGPAMLGIVRTSDVLLIGAELGAIMLMFVAGLETDVRQLRRVGVAAGGAAVGGVILPFLGGVTVARVFGLALAPSLFVGALLTATSVSISTQTLRELGRANSREGLTILGAAVIDDMLGLSVLAGVIAYATGTGWLALVRMALFVLFAPLVGLFLVPRLGAWAARLRLEGASLSMAIIIALAYAWSAEAFGSVAAITGAYVAGLAVARSDIRVHALDGAKAIGVGFLVPVFFMSIGMQAELRHLAAATAFVAVLVVTATVTKIAGCGVGAWVGQLTPLESTRVGIGMISRGEVALVVATAGRTAGIIDDTLYAAAVALALSTTLLTPLLLRAAYARTEVKGGALERVFESYGKRVTFDWTRLTQGRARR